jgi:formate hydrogenlyase subunit 3/multisubunit Na+/H+ antiporter MnhD subunit
VSLLLPLAVLVPLGLLGAMAWPAARPGVFRHLWAAPLPGLTLAVFAEGSALVLDPGGLHLTLALDAPGALLLGATALLWSGAGLYASAQMAGRPGSTRFAAWWLLTLSGSLGVFLAGDLFSFYLAFAVVSLAAFGLVAHDGTPAARRAGGLYLVLAVAGEIALLLAFALLDARAEGPSIAIADVAPVLRSAPGGVVIAALLVLGFGLKMGLLPLHVWLPVAHPAAPAPGSAVLSGAVIKAGVIGLIRFLPWDGEASGWGGALAVLGFLTAYWGVAIGLTQRNPKTVLAYSSVSQMGVVAAVLGMGLHLGIAEAPLHAAFYALHHVLAKGALFLGVGVALAAGRAGAALVLPLAVLLALGFGGLPPLGGALAKAATKAEFGAGLAAAAAMLSALGSTMLMLHFVHRLRTAMGAADGEAVPRGMAGAWLGLGALALLLPWALYPAVMGGWPEGLWSAKTLGPVAGGAALAALWTRWGAGVPAVPPGDILVLAARGAAPREALSRGVLALERLFRPWVAAGLALLAIVLGLFGLMAAAGP